MRSHIRITHKGKDRIIIALIVVGALLVFGAYQHDNRYAKDARQIATLRHNLTILWHACVPRYTGGGVTQCLQPRIAANNTTGQYITRREFNVWRVAFADDMRTVNGDNNAQWGQLRAIVCHIRLVRVNMHRVMWTWTNAIPAVGICMKGDVSRSTASLRTTG
jgi:hypothetical protein